MNNKIIWVFGPSAAGKETFINYIARHEPTELLARLGWLNKKIVVCAESLAWVQQAENDGNAERRKNLIKVIEEYSQNNKNSIILIKGQDLDLHNDALKIVKELLPNEEHEVIFLDVRFDILYQRYMTKKWWKKSMTEAVCQEWAKTQIRLLINQQHNGFKIKAINSLDFEYPETNFPPDNL